MFKSEERKYNSLNKLAECGGIVIFGGTNDSNIPLGELKQAFSLEAPLYNRSFPQLSIEDAPSLYERFVAPLLPETLLLHIGEADLNSFSKDPSDFDAKYHSLIAHIKEHNPKCRIVIVSLKNPESTTDIDEMNRHLKYISQSEQCEFGDVASKRVWNPKSTKETMSFLYSLGFVRPLKQSRPIYDLIKILFCYEQPCM